MTEPFPGPDRSRKQRLARVVPRIRRVLDDRDATRAELAKARKRLRARQQRVTQLEKFLERERKRVASHELALTSLHAELDTYKSPVATEGDDLEYVFIMTYGRSGSTLLQMILNSAPGVLIRGENGGMVPHLYAYHRQALKEIEARGTWAESPGSAYYGINHYPIDTALGEFRQLVTETLLRPMPDTRIVGFKEIRWYMPDLAEYVAFLRSVFPGARFVVNTRNIAETAKSRWWTQRDDPEGTIARLEERILAVAADLGDAAHRVVYDDYVADPGKLEAMFDWLGVPFDLDEVERVMATKYSV